MCITKVRAPFSFESWLLEDGGVLKRSPLLPTPQKPGS